MIDRYQRAYVDFFEDRLVEYGYDWKRLVLDYMCEGKEPLINGITNGGIHATSCDLKYPTRKSGIIITTQHMIAVDRKYQLC